MVGGVESAPESFDDLLEVVIRAGLEAVARQTGIASERAAGTTR